MKQKLIYAIVLIWIGIACDSNKISENQTIALTENWKLFRVKTNESYPTKIPGCVHTDLFSNKAIEDPFYRTNEKNLQWIDKEDWYYITEFEVTDNLLTKERIELNFKGLDTYADVYLNNSIVLQADNMFREWNIECKEKLKKGKNILKVYFHSPITVGLQKLAANGYALPASNDQSENGELADKRVSPFTRKAPFHYGWDWGPRFVTSGIWRPIYLKAWSVAKINSIQFVQNDLTEKKASLSAICTIESTSEQTVNLEITNTKDNLNLSSETIQLRAGKNEVKLDFEIENPKRWWSNGLGEPYLYQLETKLISNGTTVEKTQNAIGLRTLKLVQNEDENGKSFYFELNGKPVFMKGANHIPNDIFLNRVTPQIYEREIKSAANANMNMLRVWGGGIYEEDVFYELCDKYGILVWQDFMFACSMYPNDEAFFKSVEQEAIDNVVRLRNHPSIALWCGNNEIDVAWQQFNENGGWGWKQQYTPEQRAEIWAAYETIFKDILPNVVRQYDANRAYQHSSPIAANNEHASYTSTSGDMHYWDVWHGKKPFSEFLKVRSRFMSEYGFQSFPELETVKKYALPEDFDIESEVMAAHQRSGIGNLRIKEYMSWYYKMPTNFENFLYVGQVLQAESMKMAIEAHRRDMPYTMGSLYWQMNDCWSVASWSGTDYYGNWKALNYFAKQAFNPILVSPVQTEKEIQIFVVSDKLKNLTATLKVELFDFDGHLLFEKSTNIDVLANTSKNYLSLQKQELATVLKNKNIVLLASVYEASELLSSNELYFTEIKNLNLPKTNIETVISKEGEKYSIELKSNTLAKNVYLNVLGDEGLFTVNYFDLIPGKTKIIEYIPSDSKFILKDNLIIKSLVETYLNEK